MNSLLDPREFRVLEGLRFNPRKSFTGKIRGERLTKKKGISIEFSDYRDYSEGDDLRHMDWNVLARLETPIMRTYRDEEDLAIHLLIDASESMEFGEPSKSEFARKCAVAFGYIGLMGGDAVYACRLGLREAPSSGLRGRSAFARLNAEFGAPFPLEVEKLPLSMAIRHFASSSARVGMVVLVTDGLDPNLPGAIRTLGGRGHEVLFLQVLSDVELDPDLEGDLRLVDSEADTTVEITANGSALKQYRENLRKHNEQLRDAILRIGGRYALIRSDAQVEDVVRSVLKREGWVR